MLHRERNLHGKYLSDNDYNCKKVSLSTRCATKRVAVVRCGAALSETVETTWVHSTAKTFLHQGTINSTVKFTTTVHKLNAITFTAVVLSLADSLRGVYDSAFSAQHVVPAHLGV